MTDTRGFRSRHLLATLTLAAIACSADDGATNPENHRPFQASFVPPQRTTPRTLDDEFADLARTIPGFGGMYYDDAGALTATLIDLNQTVMARVELDGYLREKKAMNRGKGSDRQLAVGGDVQFRQAMYDFATLKDWYNRLSPSMWATPGGVASDIDEVSNRLRFTFEDSSHFARARLAMLSLSVPPEAVILDTGRRPTATGWLTEYRRPIPGGMMIRMRFAAPPDTFQACTLGFSVHMPGDTVTPYFITASHCSDSTFMTDNGPYYQRAEWQPWEFVGTELWDPPLIVNTEYCRGAPMCRWSEATLVQYNDHQDYFGRLAYPWNDGNGTIGIYDYVTREIVEDNGGPPFVGMQLAKLGHTGGARKGDVSRWCVDIPHGTPGVLMLCQGVVKFNVKPGDSGSPVFSIGGVEEPNNSYHVRLYGIVWAGIFDPFDPFEADSSVVSGIGSIRSEIGYFTTCGAWYCQHD